MNGMNDLMAFAWFAAYLSVSCAMLAVFSRVYMMVTPYDEVADIKGGLMAPAVAKAGAMVGFTIPLMVASFYNIRLLEYVGWGIVAMLVQLGVYKLLYLAAPKSIETNNVAVATMFAVTAVCVGMINGVSMIP